MSSVSWDKATVYLAQKLEHARARYEDFEGSDYERGKLSGEIKALKDMINLPNALGLLEEHDLEAKNNARS